MNEEIYQEFIIELYKKPLNYGVIENPDFKAEVHNPTCGDNIVLYLKVENEIIADAKHSGKGCAISQASASLLTEYLRGKRIDEVKDLTKEDILDMIKINLTKNPTRMRCALLPLDALKIALKQ